MIPVAAVAFVAPEIVSFRPARIDVELQGQHTRGRTVVETRASSRQRSTHEFAADIDADKARVHHSRRIGQRGQQMTALRARNRISTIRLFAPVPSPPRAAMRPSTS